MSAHTPSPWTHYDDTTPAGKTGRHEVVALGRTVAHIYYADEQGKADARLISVAPDLLQAAKRLHAFLTKPEWQYADYMEGSQVDEDIEREAAALAALIAKATGVQP